MAPKRILVLHGHPGQSSLSKSLTTAYAQAAANAGHEVRQHDLGDMSFDMDFGGGGYKNYKPLEPQLQAFVDDLQWADHFVVSTPLWWGAIPAKLKGLFDRTLLPGTSFDTRTLNRWGMPSPLMNGKTARVMLLADTPGWFLRLFYSDAIKRILSRQILGFIGIKPTKFSQFSPTSEADAAQVAAWLDKVSALGARAA